MDNESIKKEIEVFFQKLHVPVSSIEILQTGDISIFNISTPDSGMVIGKGGEHLKALNYLINLMLSSKDEKTRVNIDINGYRQNEMNELMAEARKVAEEVRKTKIEKEMRPMSSYERLVIHNMFTDDIHIETLSKGIGKERRVVIKYLQI